MNYRSVLAVATLTLLASAAFAPTIAADVIPERLANVDREPQNWLMNHRSYDSQRYSPLDKINKANIKTLKLAYAVAIGGTSANENLQATPLAEDGFLYVVDQWGVVYKIDARAGDMARIVWRMDPGQEKLPLSNRGAALWGNLVISTANYPPRIIATNKDNGKVAWETNLSDGQPDLRGTWTNFDSTPMEPDSTIKGASYAGAFDQVDSPISPMRRSMVVEPANGLVRIKPFAEEDRDYHRARITDHWLHQSPWERCITRGVPGIMLPSNYNNGYEIRQSTGLVVMCVHW